MQTIPLRWVKCQTSWSLMLNYEEILHDQLRLRYLIVRFKLDELNSILDFVKKH